MREKCGCLQAVLRISVALGMTACANLLWAQNDLQVMVNGPWSYATDPTHPGRIFLVAPASTHHQSYIFLGTTATDFPNHKSDIVQPGLYVLDISNRGTPVLSSGEGPVLGTASPDKARVAQIVGGAMPTNPSAPLPYVVSLPKPDSYSTYVDPSGHYDGFSESKVYSTPQEQAAPQTVRPQIYTTWMVLHYGVNSFPSDVSVTGPQGRMPTLTTTASQPGVSIVSGDPVLNEHDNECDSISLESFQAQTTLWNLPKRYARFPLQQLLPPGVQIHYHYDYQNCGDTLVAGLVSEAPAKEKKPPFAGGSADCHTYQLSINNALP